MQLKDLYVHENIKITTNQTYEMLLQTEKLKIHASRSNLETKLLRKLSGSSVRPLFFQSQRKNK